MLDSAGMAGLEPQKRIAALDRQITAADQRASLLRRERRALRAQLRDEGMGWAAIGQLSGVSPAAIQKDLQDVEQRARSNEVKRNSRRKTAEPASA